MLWILEVNHILEPSIFFAFFVLLENICILWSFLQLTPLIKTMWTQKVGLCKFQCKCYIFSLKLKCWSRETNVWLNFIWLSALQFHHYQFIYLLVWVIVNMSQFSFGIICNLFEISLNLNTCSFAFPTTLLYHHSLHSYETLFFIVCKVVQHWQKEFSKALPTNTFCQKNITKNIYYTLINKYSDIIFINYGPALVVDYLHSQN